MEWSSAQLRSLVELHRLGTITAVAAALNYTPGGVSHQIAALERSAGVELLHRVGRRVEFTDAGAVLAEHAKRMLAAEADAIAALERTSNEVEGDLDIGVFATVAAEMLPATIERINERYPRLNVRSRDMDVDVVYQAVASGRVDLAIGLDYTEDPIPRDPDLLIDNLYSERFSIAAPADYLPGRESISLADTGRMPWILPDGASHYGRAIRSACRRAGVEPNVQHEVTDTAAALILTEAGLGICPVTPLMLALRPSSLQVLTVDELVERHLVIITRTASAYRPSIRALKDVLMELPAGSTSRVRR